MKPSLDSILKERLSTIASSNQFRKRQVVRPIDSVHAEIDGSVFTNFCSNDYLGLTHHPRVMAAMRDAIELFGVGSGASGLVCGYTRAHANAESAIAAWKGTEASVLCPSGHQANLAAIQTLAALGTPERPVRFLMDKLVHASVVDAVRGTSKAWRIYPHQGMDKLKRLLEDANPNELQVVVTESIFSMDGDAADLAALARLKDRHHFVLLLDEAHGSGVYGQDGAGVAAELGFPSLADVSIVTLSKAAGCIGGAICGSTSFCDAVINLGRAYLFSTSLPPSVAAGIEASIAVMRDEPWRQDQVRSLARSVRSRLSERGVQIPGGDSPIVPVILQNEMRVLSAAAQLAEHRLLVQAIRPPTVPRGTSRLRITLSCNHENHDIDRLIDAVVGLIA